MLRALVGAAAVGVAGAQLFAEPLVDLPTLRAELERLGELGAEEQAVPETLSSPTICDPSVKQHSGYLPVGVGTSYFFWLFESRRSPSTDPLVLWLTGGPGCSSQLALLAENGPCKVNQDGVSTMLNKYSWTTQANVMWVDQPAATGFSTGLPLVTHDENGVAANMYTFMQRFYETLPEYKGRDFYIFGESYAGHYVPAVGHYLWQKSQSGGLQVPLKGIGIGNGLVEPGEQYKWYPEMGLNGGKAEGGSLEKGVFSQKQYAVMKAATIPCAALIHECNTVTNVTLQLLACENAYVVCNYGELIPYQLSGWNPYDMRTKCEKPPLCYDFSNVEKFLNAKDTQSQLGVNKKWGSCNRLVNMGFLMDWMKNFENLLPDLLADGIQVLVYAGDADYICNWIGNKKWALSMQWPHQADFNAAADEAYSVAGRQVGRLRAANGFHFLQVFAAGHMVPMDQPEAAMTMLNDFLSGKMGKRPDQATCTGDLDPAAPICFKGSQQVLGFTETAEVKVSKFAAGGGSLDFSLSGIYYADCSGLPFQKKGQDIALDVTSCVYVPGLTLGIKFCSDSQSVELVVSVPEVPETITATLTRAPCDALPSLVV